MDFSKVQVQQVGTQKRCATSIAAEAVHRPATNQTVESLGIHSGRKEASI